MMTPEETLSKFENTAKVWLDALGKYTEEQFARVPGEDSWSIGQVYAHLIGSTHGLALRHLGLCTSGEAPVTDEPKTMPGETVFATGSFPQMQIKVPPSPQYTPAQPDSTEEARKGLNGLLDAMRSILPNVATADPARKSPHPVLGMLNAAEWFQLGEMHFRHHLDQKQRLDSWLGATDATTGADATANTNATTSADATASANATTSADATASTNATTSADATASAPATATADTTAATTPAE